MPPRSAAWRSARRPRTPAERDDATAQPDRRVVCCYTSVVVAARTRIGSLACVVAFALVGVGCGEGSEQSGGASTTESRSEEHTSELQSLMRISYAVFCLKKK